MADDLVRRGPDADHRVGAGGRRAAPAHPGQLYVVAVTAGVCTVFFDVAYQSYLPVVVAREQLVDGNGKLGATQSFAQVAGPGLGGGLVGLIGAARAMGADAISYAISVASLLVIRVREVTGGRGGRGGLGGEVSPQEQGGSRGDRPPWSAPWVPVLVGLLLTWVLIADPLVLLVGVVPLVAVCALRVSRDLARRQDTSVQAVLRARWYELSLAVAAIAAQGLASLAMRLLQAYLHPLAYQLAPVHTWPRHAWVTGKGLLVLFGAKPEGPPAEMAFALLHLAGVALVAWAVLRVARRFLSWPDMISQILLVAMVLNVVAYVPSTLANATDLNAREFAVVLPFGAVLAGRTLAASLHASVRRRPRAAVLLAGALLACYGAGLGYAAAQPSVPPMKARLAKFLAAHHLTSGIGGYWGSSVVTVGSDGAVTIRAVASLPLAPYPWEAKSSWYDPGHNQANFLVTGGHPGFFNNWQPKPAALAALGRPVRTYRTGPYTVYVYDKNLLAELSHQ
jgi:hypothetical protein